jgi:hypothetical protein
MKMRDVVLMRMVVPAWIYRFRFGSRILDLPLGFENGPAESPPTPVLLRVNLLAEALTLSDFTPLIFDISKAIRKGKYAVAS